jgi:hypothetical protein
MSIDEEARAGDVSGPFTNPFPALIGGAVAVILAFLLSSAVGSTWSWLTLLLLVTGCLATGCGVAIRPASSAVLGTAAFTALLGSLERREAGWDSGALLLAVLAGVAIVAAGLVALPRTARRVAVSVLIVYHFGGILTAVTSASPAWVFQQMWNHVYRPYLQFMYLNNAYHFYSPEPGPAPLLWFHVQYGDPQREHAFRWVKVPDNDNPDGKPRRPDGTRIWPNVEYTRRLSLAESTNFPANGTPGFEILASERMRVSPVIPIHPGLPLANQYREPNEVSKRWTAAYVRHVARMYRHEQHPELPVTGVKVYRVIHEIFNPKDVLEGREPSDPASFVPIYMGEFDAEGRMKESSRKVELLPDGLTKEVNRDPLLYWVIPIIKEPRRPHQPSEATRPHAEEEPELKDYLTIHANGDMPNPSWYQLKSPAEKQQ